MDKNYIKNGLRRMIFWFRRNKDLIGSLMACGMIGAFGAASYKLGYDDGKFVERHYMTNKLLDSQKE